MGVSLVMPQLKLCLLFLSCPCGRCQTSLEYTTSLVYRIFGWVVRASWHFRTQLRLGGRLGSRLFILTFLCQRLFPLFKLGDACESEEATFTRFGNIVSCLIWFHIIRSSVGESGLIGYAFSELLASSLAGSFCTRDFNFWVIAFLDRVDDILVCLGFYIDDIVPVGQVLVNYEVRIKTKKWRTIKKFKTDI